MANSYFNYSDPVSPGDRIASNKYNGDFGGVARAFDILPSPDELVTNTGNYAVSSGTATAYQVSLPSFEGGFGYIEGMQVIMRAHVTNAGPATLSINGAAPVAIKNILTGSGPGYALVAGDIAVNAIYSLRYDGTQFQVVNTVASALISSQTAAQQATFAASSASTSAGSASASAGSASAASTSATNSASAASTSASAASTSASAASTSASAASTSATNAASSASAASTSATTASNSATTASNSASAAAGSASAASTSANNAASSASAANTSATNAAASAASAAAVLTSTAFNNAVMAVQLNTTLVVNIVKFYAANIDPNTMFPGTTWVRLAADYSIRTAQLTGANVLTVAGADQVTINAASLPSHTHTSSVTLGSFTYPQTATSSTSLASNISTETYDYGTITSSAYGPPVVLSAVAGGAQTTTEAGAHTHSVFATNITPTTGTSSLVGQATAVAAGVGFTQTAGSHTHTVNYPAHSHTFTMPSHSHQVVMGSHAHTFSYPSHNHTLAFSGHTHTFSATLGNTGTGNPVNILNKVIYLVGWRRTV